MPNATSAARTIVASAPEPVVSAAVPDPVAPARLGSLPAGSDALWHTFAYFNYYRLAVASVFLVGAFIYGTAPEYSADRASFLRIDLAYWVLALGFALTHRRRWLRFDYLLTLQVCFDILALTLLMHTSGGHRSGLAIMLIVVLAGAGLVGQGRLSLFYAAMATLAVLAEQAYRALRDLGDPADFVGVGFTSIGFFATAITARLLAQRVIAHQELARQRGLDLDIQLRLSERIIRDMQDGVLVLEPDGHVRQFNPQAGTLLGADLTSIHQVREVSSALAQAFEDFLSRGGAALAQIRGEPRGNAVRVRFVRPADGGAVLVFLEDLARIQAQAQQIKLAALGRLTASIAHEIRNPLAAITHAAELLREEKRGDMLNRLTRIVQDNSSRIERMVKDILELGRRDRAEPEVIALRPFIGTFVDEFCLHGSAARAVFRVEGDDDAKLCFDRAHLNQVLWNLVGNAQRFCSGQPGAVRLVVEGGGSAIRTELHIIDDGPGIAEEARGRVFEPFFTTDPQGTGLGLYIARELCDANRASLELLANAPGAHFCIMGLTKEP